MRLISRDKGCAMSHTKKGKLVRLIKPNPTFKLKFQKNVVRTKIDKILLYPKTRKVVDNIL